jgi:chromosome segregation ATPase
VCDTACQKEKAIEQTQAAWQKISSDPTADPEARRQAYQAYMTALHGPAWLFQHQQTKKEAKLVAEANVDAGKLENLQAQAAKLNADIAALDATDAGLDASIEQVSGALAEAAGEIVRGQEQARTLERVLQLRDGLGPARGPPGAAASS